MSSPSHALIMAGGKGERFWPWSRAKRPKQLLPLFGKKTLIEMTVERLLPLIPRRRIWIVTNAAQARAMARLMPSFPRSNFIVEPAGKDSAGAVMLGCALVARRDPQAVMALLPADHLIKDTRAYRRALGDGFALAAAEPVMVTLGIKPVDPSTAYGYIERGARLRRRFPGNTPIFEGRRFLEKPDLATARKFLKLGRYYWNAGMFIWSAATLRDAFVLHSPVHAAGWAALQKNPSAYLAGGFLKLPKISIDYAVMEKSRNLRVAEGRFDWDDVGSWTSLPKHLGRDARDNCVRGTVLSLDSRNSLVLGQKRLIALIGVRDLVVVQTDDATLICHRDAVQRVKELTRQLPSGLR